MLTVMMSLLRNQKGQGLVEYGLILALVSVVAIGALGLLGGGVIAELGKATAAL